MGDQSPAEEMRAAATKLRRMIAAARKDLRSSTYYGHNEANYTAGINNACGGAAGELASFTPEFAEHIVADLEACADDYARTERIARQWTPSVDDVDTVLDWCEESDSIRRALAIARLINGEPDAR
jgi:hypothetical protein